MGWNTTMGTIKQFLTHKLLKYLGLILKFSLQTADEFPVVVSLPPLQRERSDDWKCVCCSQANLNWANTEVKGKSSKQQGLTYPLQNQHGIYRPWAVVFFSSEPRAVSEKVKICKFFLCLGFSLCSLQHSCSPQTNDKCSQFTVTQKKNKRLLAVYGIYGKMIDQHLHGRIFVANQLINTVKSHRTTTCPHKISFIQAFWRRFIYLAASSSLANCWIISFLFCSWRSSRLCLAALFFCLRASAWSL